MKSRSSYSLILLIFAAVLLTSCASRSVLRFDTLFEVTGRGDFSTAIRTIQHKPGLYGKTNRFLYNMDIGVLYHFAGRFDSSNVYLLKAADIYDQLFTRSISNEAVSMLTNDNVRPYRSKPYELVLCHQFIALNYLAEENVDDAVVEAKRTQLLFNEWERKGYKDGKYSTDGMFHFLSSLAFDAQGQTDDAMISLYNAVKAFQNGPVALPPEVNNFAYHMFRKNDRMSDAEQLKIVPNQGIADWENFGNEESEIVVIGYAGKGPVIREQVWWGTYVKDGLLVLNYTPPDGQMQTITMPAPSLPPEEYEKAAKGKKTRSGTTFHIKVALPVLQVFPSETDHFTIQGNCVKGSVKTFIINDLGKQAQKQMDDTHAATVARTVIRVVLRTIAAQKTKEELKTSSPVANLLLNIGTDILADQLEKADTRNCFLIPQTVQVARIPVKPGIYTIEIGAKNRTGGLLGSKTFTDITVGRHQKKLVFY